MRRHHHIRPPCLRTQLAILAPPDAGTLAEQIGERARKGRDRIVLAFHVRAGDAETGRYRVAIDGEVLFDETVQTRDAGPWGDLGFLKSYGGPLVRFLADRDQQLLVAVGDIEIWDRPPPDAFPAQTPRQVTISVASSVGASITTSGSYRAGTTATMILGPAASHETVPYEASEPLLIDLESALDHSPG